jgi:O-antigen/teichoic acid export membrane protein
MIGFCLISMINSAAMFVDIWKRYPDFTPWWGGGSFRGGFLNLRRSVVLTANGFLQQLSLSGLVLLVGSTLGAVVVPAFTTVRTVANLFAQATNVFLAPLAPDMSRFHVTGQKDKLGTTFAICWLVNGIAVNAAMLLTLFLIEPLYEWWTRGELEFSWPLYLSCILSVSFINFGAPFVAYLKSINNLQALLLITVSRGILIFGGAFVLLPWLGPVGAGIALILGEVPASCIIPVVYCRDVVLSDVMLRSTVAAAVNLLIMGGAFIAILTDGDSIYLFTGLALLCIMVSALYQWYVLPRVGKERVHQMLAKVQSSVTKVLGRAKA